jgi:hypothetical protein
MDVTGKQLYSHMDNERTSISTHAIMDKVREMELYPVVLGEGKFSASKRLARAMEIAYRALSSAGKDPA